MKPQLSKIIATLLLGVAWAVISVGGVSAQSEGEAAPRVLFDPVATGAAERLKPSNETVSATAVGDGLDVVIEPGPTGFPGINILPPEGGKWDLSAYSRIETTLTNTSNRRMRLMVRVDSDDPTETTPYQTEYVALDPGESKPIKVYFGYTAGQPGYKSKPEAITKLLFFAGKCESQTTFHIGPIVAAGFSGEAPPADPDTLRVTPLNGTLLGPGIPLDAQKQILAKNGAEATIDGSAVQVNFLGGAAESATFKPPSGGWSLVDYVLVRVKIKNVGDVGVTPRVRLDSKGGPTDVVALESEISPDAEGEVVIPFAAALPVQIEMAQEKARVVAGTGTSFTSNFVSGVTLLPGLDSPRSNLVVTAIRAESPVAELPSWLGQKPPVEGDWVQTLNENFDVGTIDLTKWSVYADNYWDKRCHFSKDNVLLDSGKVLLRFEKKTGFHNDDPNDTKTVGKTNYATGFLDGRGKWTQRYGYFESRMKLPKAPGLWPAFWLMPDRGKDSGPGRHTTKFGGMEFDIVEFLSGWGPHCYNIAMHWDGYYSEHRTVGVGTNYVQTDAEGYITGGLLWTPGLAVFYANGKEFLRWENPRIADVQSYILFTAVSGGWDNLPLDDITLPSDFIIDYVRVWQRKDLASDEDGPKPNNATLKN